MRVWVGDGAEDDRVEGGEHSSRGPNAKGERHDDSAGNSRADCQSLLKRRRSEVGEFAGPQPCEAAGRSASGGRPYQVGEVASHLLAVVAAKVRREQ